MKSIKFLPVVAFAAIIFASCDNADPIMSRLMPYEFVNKLVYMTPAQQDSAFAANKYVGYKMSDGDETIMYYFEDSTKLANFLTYMTAENVTAAQYASLGNIFESAEGEGVAYVTFSESLTTAKANFTTVDEWSKNKIYDGMAWMAQMETADSTYAYLEGSAYTDSITSLYDGDHAAFVLTFNALDSLEGVEEIATVNGENDMYEMELYQMDSPDIEGDAYGFVYIRMIEESSEAPKKLALKSKKLFKL